MMMFFRMTEEGRAVQPVRSPRPEPVQGLKAVAQALPTQVSTSSFPAVPERAAPGSDHDFKRF
jgi:methyl-accepting chemotaxis protein